MTELGNCAACRKPFHDSAHQHACKGCGGKIHSSILCPKCPKVVDHEEDNWCSDHFLYKNWSYGEDCPVLITNADPHIIGTVGVVGSGGVVSTVVVLQDDLEKGDQGEHDLADRDERVLSSVKLTSRV